jgi:hypothetical protein
MKNLQLFFFIVILTTLSSCSIIEGIFKAGVWIGVLAVLFVVGIIFYFFTRGSRKK